MVLVVVVLLLLLLERLLRVAIQEVRQKIVIIKRLRPKEAYVLRIHLACFEPRRLPKNRRLDLAAAS